ncbi:hypothetical protein SAMN05216362_1456 [Piscibacillus halophilus]|uniref:Uncharacterized protein n=1 Tax=Piscibacillus halophilus TaxID=571933 RepID=A0A1H9L8A4_9BACI|nr:hypothetical protein SAMN05216362_1456 [Piscibacillus halophilus]
MVQKDLFSFLENKERLGTNHTVSLQRARALNIIIINAINYLEYLTSNKAVEYQKRSGSFNKDLLHTICRVASRLGTY